MQQEHEPSHLQIWEDAPSFASMSNTFLAVLFHINPMTTHNEAHKSIITIHQDLTRRLRPWIESYVWDKDTPKVEICERKNDDGYHYVFVELELGDTDIDEWLMTSILWEMSETYEDLYIKTWDSEGEHVLIESWESLPEWLEPQTARNRAWINHKRVVIVPEVFYKDRGLLMEEALKFLEKAAYKCLRVIEIDKSVQRKCKQYPQRALEAQVIMEVEVSRGVAGALMKETNCVNPAVIDHLKQLSIVENSQLRDYHSLDDPVTIKVPTRVESYLMLDLWMKQKNATPNFPKDGGKIVDEAVLNYIERTEIKQSYTPLDEEIAQFNDRGDVLQKELIRLLRIDQYVEPKLDLGPPNDTEMPDKFNENDMMSKLDQFFKDNESGLSGVENVDKRRKDKIPKGVKLEELMDNESESDSDDADEDNEDDAAREFLKGENVDIDEDDFFEYFAKEALKLSDEDLEAFRSLDLENEVGDNEHKHSEDSDDDDDDDSSSSYQLDNENMQQALKDLLKSLQGGLDGPAATFLQNMR